MQLVKLLTAVLFSFLTYDTLHFVLFVNKSLNLDTGVEVRPNYEAATIKMDMPLDELNNDDIFIGVGCFAFLIAATASFTWYFMKVFSHLRRQKLDDMSNTAVVSVPERPAITYYPNDRDKYPQQLLHLTRNVSRNDLNASSKSANYNWTSYSRQSIDNTGNERLEETTGRNFPSELTIGDDGSFTGSSEISNDEVVVTMGTSESVQNTTKFDNTITQTDPTAMCDCNMENFEERLGAVEHTLKTSEEATKEWSKRIEQAEVDLVNLHRQMYTILTKAEFVPPSSDVFSKTAGDRTPTDFYDPTIYKIPEIIVETKKEIEQGDLFKKSLSQLTSEDNWSAEMEKELTQKINEIRNTSLNDANQTSYSSASTDLSKIKENLMKKNDELKDKARQVVKEMEDAINANSCRKNKINVHSHFVASYKRIQNADLDIPINVSNKGKPRSKFK